MSPDVPSCLIRHHSTTKTLHQGMFLWSWSVTTGLQSCDFDTALGAVVEISGGETRKWKQNWSASPIRGTWLQKSWASYRLVWKFQKGNSQIIKHQLVDHEKLQKYSWILKVVCGNLWHLKVIISVQGTSTLGSWLHQNDASSVSEENCQ